MVNRHKTSKAERIFLQVLSAASTSATQEVNMALSIIDLNAGLLNTLAESEDGQRDSPVEETVQKVASEIIDQVARVTKIMNRLEHFYRSREPRTRHVRLGDSLSAMITLTNRQAAAKDIVVSYNCPSDCVLRSRLFAFESLLYLVLCRLYQTIPVGGELCIRVVENIADVTIGLSMKDVVQLSWKRINTPGIVLLAELAGWTLTIGNKSINIKLDRNLEAAGRGMSATKYLSYSTQQCNA